MKHLMFLIPLFLVTLFSSCNQEQQKEVTTPNDEEVISRASSCYQDFTGCSGTVLRVEKGSNGGTGLIKLTYYSNGDCNYTAHGGVKQIIYNAQAFGYGDCTYESDFRGLSDFLTPTTSPIVRSRTFAGSTFGFDVCQINATNCANPIGGGVWCPSLFATNGSNGYYNTYLYFECAGSGLAWATGKSEEDVDVEYDVSVTLIYKDDSQRTYFGYITEEGNCDCN